MSGSLQNCDPPRWTGGPQICRATNRPAFPSPKEAKAFLDQLPAISLDAMVSCEACGGVHAIGHDRPPAGASSGSSTRQLTKRIPEFATAGILLRALKRKGRR